jgi:uncharacterized MnhB-related membrane protein
MGAAVFGGLVARSWYMAIVLGTIFGVIARFGYVWIKAGSLARPEIDAAVVGTILGSAVAGVLVHMLNRWRRG